MAFSHGSNDGQKFMGTFTLALGLAGVLPSFRIPVWVIFTCAGTMALGTLTGGWRIMREAHPPHHRLTAPTPGESRWRWPASEFRARLIESVAWTTHPPNPDHPPVVLHYKHCELFGLAPPLDAFPSDPSQRFSPLGR